MIQLFDYKKLMDAQNHIDAFETKSKLVQDFSIDDLISTEYIEKYILTTIDWDDFLTQTLDSLIPDIMDTKLNPSIENTINEEFQTLFARSLLDIKEISNNQQQIEQLLESIEKSFFGINIINGLALLDKKSETDLAIERKNYEFVITEFLKTKGKFREKFINIDPDEVFASKLSENTYYELGFELIDNVRQGDTISHF